MGDNHLTDAAIFSVFLNDDEAPGLVDRRGDGFLVPRYDRSQIKQLDAYFVVDLGEGFERFLNRISPRDQRDVGTVAKFAGLTEGNCANRLFRFAFRPKHVFWN